MENEKIIISLGGSLIVPNEIDVQFLKDFKDFIISETQIGKKFVIITGGGKTARAYQAAAKSITTPDNNDLDWLGIASLRLNAELLRIVFDDYADAHIVENNGEDFVFTKPIIIGSAYKPGSSSDLGAVKAAFNVGAKKVINLSNIDYAYDKDPNKYPDARKLETISWGDYRNLIPNSWEPGLSTPFDPIASEKAESLGIEVAIMNGRNIENLKNYLDGKTFVGTVIK